MSYLEELQAQVKPLTLPEMTAVRARAEQDAADATKIFYERVFQQQILPRLTREIGEKGVLPAFGFYVGIWDAIDRTRVPNTKENPKHTKETYQGLTDYVRERLKTLIPDYTVAVELEIKACWSPFWPSSFIAIALGRKEPGYTLGALKAVEKTTFTVRNPEDAQKAREPFVLQHKAYM